MAIVVIITLRYCDYVYQTQYQGFSFNSSSSPYKKADYSYLEMRKPKNNDIK